MAGAEMLPDHYQLNRNKRLLAGALLSFALAFSVYSLVIARPWINRPFPGFTVLRNNLVPTIWMPGWAGFQRGVKFGDIVVAADGRAFTSGDDLNQYIAALKPGTPISYTIKRGGQNQELVIPVSVFTLQDYLILFSVMIGFGFFYFFIGLIVFYLKPRLAASRALLFNSAVLGFTLMGGPEYCTTHHNLVLLFTLPFVGPSFVVLSLYFPETQKIRRPLMALCLGTAVPIMIFYLACFNHISRFVVVDAIMLVHLSANNLLAFYLFGRSFYSSRDPFTRQKSKLVIYGVCLMVAGCLPFLIGTLILKIMTFFWFLCISLMLLPLSIAYAVLARNLFDVDVFIRRTISYVLASAVAVVLLFGLIAALSFALQDVTQQSSQISSILATLLVVAIFRPLHNRVNESINRRFFRQGYEYRSTIQKASQLLSSMIELDALTHCILDTIMDAIEIENGSLSLREMEPDRFRICVRRDRSENVTGEGSGNQAGTAAAETIPADHALIQFLESNPTAIQLTALERLPFPPEQLEQIRRLMQEWRVVLVIPIVYEFRLIGVLGLGPKGSGAWYSSEDMDLLQTLMNQTAVSIENARKVEELKRMVELETSYRDLKALDEMKDNFLSMVSHDLRAPMTGIQGYAYLMQDLILEERPKQYLNIIIQQSERLTRLVNDLLDFQRFAAGRMDLKFVQLDLVGLVREALDAFRGATLQKQLTLSDSIPDREIPILGHRDRLHQALSNLLSNAVKFTPRHGHITVRVEWLDLGAKPCVKVAVRDDGPGIPAELQGQLFEKFQQVHQQIEGAEQGSGLGLALVRQIIEHHQGTVGVDSEPGRGSEFYFLLPVLSPQPGNPEGSEIHG